MVINDILNLTDWEIHFYNTFNEYLIITAKKYWALCHIMMLPVNSMGSEHLGTKLLYMTVNIYVPSKTKLDILRNY